MKFLRTCLLFIFVVGGCQTRSGYEPERYLTTPEQEETMWKIIRYIARPPDGISREERFYKSYDPHYHEQMSFHRLDAYYVDDDKVNYFLITRRAPSLTDKRVATGGYFKADADGNVTDYEEVFRTWKMEPDTLVRRAIFLFDKMVKHEPLEGFYSSNTGQTDFIEFPDAHTFFDKE